MRKTYTRDDCELAGLIGFIWGLALGTLLTWALLGTFPACG